MINSLANVEIPTEATNTAECPHYRSCIIHNITHRLRHAVYYYGQNCTPTVVSIYDIYASRFFKFLCSVAQKPNCI